MPVTLCFYRYKAGGQNLNNAIEMQQKPKDHAAESGLRTELSTESVDKAGPGPVAKTGLETGARGS